MFNNLASSKVPQMKLIGILLEDPQTARMLVNCLRKAYAPKKILQIPAKHGNVAIAIVNHPPFITINGWYKPSEMGGLWHCYTHIKNLRLLRPPNFFRCSAEPSHEPCCAGRGRIFGSGRWNGEAAARH